MTHPPEGGRLLKARSTRGLGSSAAFNFEDIQKRCREEVERTRLRAGEILAEAREEAERIRAAAFDDARKEGRQQGLKDAEQTVESRATELARQMADEELQTTLPAVRKLAEGLNLERERWLSEWETGVVRLAVSIAERVVRRTIEASPDVTVDVIREALQLVAAGTRVRVRVHPQDERRLGQFADTIDRGLGSLADVEFVPDESVSPGGCVLETEHGFVDARMETQLDRILSELSA